MRTAALMSEGSPLIPAVLIAITNGERAAVESFRSKSGWLEGTISPMMNTPPT